MYFYRLGASRQFSDIASRPFLSPQFLLDDQHQPTEIHGKEEKDVNWMVAEWMIAANGSVAKRIHDAFPMLALLRCHGTPDQERMEKVAALARKRGIDFDSSR